MVVVTIHLLPAVVGKSPDASLHVARRWAALTDRQPPSVD